MSEGETTGQDKFAQDIATNKGYAYTTNAKLSSHLSNQRITDIALEMLDFKGKSVIDIGCGDGTYTFSLYDQAKPLKVLGVDAVRPSIELAIQKTADKQIIFQTLSIYALSQLKEIFDIGHIRGVLHHLDNPELAIKEALSVVDQMIIIEPNGYNFGVKLLECFSKYHREHAEKSYFPSQIDSWVKNGKGKIIKRRWAGFVPFFCPDWMARIFKWLEPFVEKTPIINRLMCAVYYVVVKRG